jgi:hypothetical protein
MTMITTPAFHSVIAAAGRSAEIPESSDLYGWLVGSWELQVRHYAAVDVSARGIVGEVHAGWVLEGRAVQDVWIYPRRSERRADMERGGASVNAFGTTLRVWDPLIEAWRITWMNPVTGRRDDQIGRRVGSDIVQIGMLPNGRPSRWRFTEITANSFHWLGESMEPDGVTWKLEGEFLAKRLA